MGPAWAPVSRGVPMSDQPWSFPPAPVEDDFEPARPPESARKAPAAGFEVRPRIMKLGKRRIFRYDVFGNGKKLSEWSDLDSAKEEAERIAAGYPVRVGRPTYE